MTNKDFECRCCKCTKSIVTGRSNLARFFVETKFNHVCSASDVEQKEKAILEHKEK